MLAPRKLSCSNPPQIEDTLLQAFRREVHRCGVQGDAEIAYRGKTVQAHVDIYIIYHVLICACSGFP